LEKKKKKRSKLTPTGSRSMTLKKKIKKEKSLRVEI